MNVMHKIHTSHRRIIETPESTSNPSRQVCNCAITAVPRQFSQALTIRGIQSF
ncbi:hypothetical protein M413DRAFT_449757 [Hebeloma cylindrosporum]|uniref:Uncharacterized protein n=1 Tax=Hebeloma cylindrosporum TaxID=76867 RepID=A0A0C2Y2Z9_HEBCY|nr:hypothetical protein M413DRAFT_449757 [Hebeloma cylindrosporum h7]